MLEYLPDLESDFSVFHRIDDIYSMPSARFFTFATRLPAYQGVLAARVMAEQEQQNPASRPGPGIQPDRVIDAAREPVQDDPALAGIVSFAGGG